MCYNAVVFFLPHPASSCGCGTRSSPSSSNSQLPSIFIIYFFYFLPLIKPKSSGRNICSFSETHVALNTLKAYKSCPHPTRFFVCFWFFLLLMPALLRSLPGIDVKLEKKRSRLFLLFHPKAGDFFFLINSIIQTEACVSHITKRDQGKKKKKISYPQTGYFSLGAKLLAKCDAILPMNAEPNRKKKK